MKVFLKNNPYIFYFLVFIALGGLLSIFYYNFRKVRSSTDLVEHTQDVIHKSNEILLEIMTIETGARGFVLTGNESFLIPVLPAMNSLPNKFLTLKALTKDNQKQHLKVDSMIVTGKIRSQIIQNIIQAKKNKTLDEITKTKFINDGIALMLLIRQRIIGFNSEEFRLLKLRKAEAEMSNKNADLLFLLLTFLLLTVFLYVAYIVKSQKNKLIFDEKIRESENLYHEMIYSSPSMIAILKGPEMIITIANDAILTSWGKGKNVIGKSLFAVLPEILDQGFSEILMGVYNTGIVYNSFETPVSIIRNGEKVLVYYNFTYQAQHNLIGQIHGIAIIASEVTTQAILNNKILESEKHFRQMAELMPEKVTNATAEGHVTYYNKSWQDYTGASLSELVANGWSQWIHADDLAETTQKWQHSIASGDDFNMDLRMKNANGQYRWHNSKAKSMRDENQNIKLWLGYNSDIHDHKTLRETLETAVEFRTKELETANYQLLKKAEEVEDSKAKLLSEYARSLIEASQDPLFTISPEGKITDVNKATIEATAVSKENLIGSSFIYYFTDPLKAKQGYEQVFAKGFVADFPLTIKDHKLTDVLFNGSVYKDNNGNILGAVVVARDITEQKNIENELNEAKVFAEMATEIAQTAKEKAEIATEIAENAVKAKQQFLSNMSHEIRTPMNAIIGFTKVVLNTTLTAKQKEYMLAIKMSGDALIVLINDILDLAKVEAGKMTFEQTPFKLFLSIEAMINLFEPKIQEKNLTLVKKYDKNIPDILIGDSLRLHQIIMNLMSNALKFTTVGKITIAVKMIDEDDETATIEFAITDTGIGIPADKMDSVFENFNQATISTSRLYGGTGLGLAIVKQLVENQHGSIQIKSTVEVGSTFSFVLTFQKAKEEVVLEPEIIELDREIKDIKVLVVEDMALNQLLMKTLLDDFGFECDITFNGKLAVEKLEATLSEHTDANQTIGQFKPYDIILMDLQMPEMNGYEATEYIRKVIKSDIPIIALTADVTTTDVAKCKAIGMNDYISKPVNERLLYSKIVALIKKPIIILATQKGAKPVMHKTVDLSYLLQRTKSNPKLMVEMITVYLDQTPPLVFAMKQSLNNEDWKMLENVVHKMIPSFSIMGMSTDFENMAKKIQEYASFEQMNEGIHELVGQLDEACTQACRELEIELVRFKNEK
jgi:PAS domain S-box-containing protein